MSARGIVRTAVLPVGGLDTGSLPAPKVAPKDRLPIVDKPLVHCAVEEALRAGVRRVIFVAHRSDQTIAELESSFDQPLAELRRCFPPDITYRLVRQPAPLGLAHAIGCARALVAEEPFLVIVPHELVDAAEPAAAQLVEAFGRFGRTIVAAAPANGRSAPHGAMEAFAFEPRLYRVTRVRRASRETSALAIVGRFVFTPEFFDHLATVPVGARGEIELAEALQAQLAARPMFACELAGERFDCRSKPGLLSATLHFGLRHPVLAETFAAMAGGAATAALRSPTIAADRTLSGARTVND